MKYLLWLLKAAIFFTLFAFALNNQQNATVHFFFGTQWQAPLVLVVLTAFVGGLIAGVLVMVPRWWKQRSTAVKLSQPAAAADTPATANSTLPEPIPPTLHGL
ncbi:lipopolysaccharide assembly LapA domain-containing protein [Comamonas sp. CMM02]|uniref:LapA family protein n=1 Tax=Comamonas sp. CMM02 TaxID=2769307 RepID=UPI0017803E5E|nr:LapA family protein [Comamonas sp. CMM02]MBD9402331.1 LapA family protein [Comamonas sp. CMM02]